MTVKTELDKNELEDRKIIPRLAEDLMFLANALTDLSKTESNTSTSVLPDNLKPSIKW